MTWSSISWGLRPIQSVKTITWFSDRSGIASTGIVSMARTPATPEHERGQDHEEAVADRPLDDRFNHGPFSVRLSADGCLRSGSGVG